MGPMATMARNRALAAQLAVMAAGTAAIAAAAYVLDAADAAVWCAVTGVWCLAVFVVVSFRRYAQIVRLSSEVDEVLHGGRRTDFTRCSEGDVAALASELAKMVARLRRVSDQLAGEKARLADAMADISHQIRTPLTALALALPRIERADDAAVRRRLVREAETLLARTSWLVASLLRMAKVEAGALDVVRRATPLSEVIARAVQPLEAAFDVRGVELRVNVAGDPAPAIDGRWCAEAFGNVVKNCMEHTPEGGVVSVTASEDALAFRVTVEDTGAGIDLADLPHVFERFYRGTHGAQDGAQEGQAGATEGFGIGLALAQALVSAQGGSIRASNRAEGGARFEIAFPKVVV